MEQLETHPEQRARPSRRREIAVGTIIPIAAFLFTVFVWGHTVFVDLIDWIVDLDRNVAINTERGKESDKRFERQFSEIIINRNNIRQIERDLADLRSVPSARPDPFTGSQGRALEQRLDHLEQSVKP